MERKQSNFDNFKRKGERDVYGNVIDWDTEGYTDETIDTEDIDVFKELGKAVKEDNSTDSSSKESV